MPTYTYRAVTKTGILVKNRVEAVSKQSLLKSLKGHDLLPISINQVAYKSMNQGKKQKRNISNVQEIMKNINTTRINRSTQQRTMSAKEKISVYIQQTQRITSRDLVVFTQNFYLLKKADFNNIHALRTLLEGTENISFRGIIEDILAGVEARRKHVYNNGVLFRCISIYIC